MLIAADDLNTTFNRLNLLVAEAEDPFDVVSRWIDPLTLLEQAGTSVRRRTGENVLPQPPERLDEAAPGADPSALAEVTFIFGFLLALACLDPSPLDAASVDTEPFGAGSFDQSARDIDALASTISEAAETAHSLIGGLLDTETWAHRIAPVTDPDNLRMAAADISRLMSDEPLGGPATAAIAATIHTTATAVPGHSAHATTPTFAQALGAVTAVDGFITGVTWSQARRSA